MTFKDLQKLVQLQANPEQVHLFNRPKNKPSWFGTSKCISKKILKIKEMLLRPHLGLLKKDYKEKPIFDYEK